MATEHKRENDFFAAWAEAQKSWIQLWADTFLRFPEVTKVAEGAKEWTTPWKTAGDIYSRWLNMSQEMFQEYWKGSPWGIGQQTFERTLGTAQVYNKLYEFWASAAKILSGTSPEEKGIPQTYQEFCNFWLQNYNELLGKFFTVPLFQPFGGVLGPAAELPQMYSDFFSKFFAPWREAGERLPGTAAEAMRKGPQGSADVPRLWLEAYEQTWGKILRMPSLGLAREATESFQRGIESLTEHQSAITDYTSALFRVGTEAMQKVASKLGEMYSKGQAPKTYKEFYTLWWTTNEDALHELFRSSEFSRLLGRVVDTLMVVKRRYDDIMERYLKALPVPTRSEMNDLYKTLYLLKKEVRKNTKQLRELEKLLGTTKTLEQEES